MELIKQIKEAEQQAGQIVEKARQDAVAMLDQAKTKRAEQLRQAQQQRIAQVEEAVAAAEKKGRIQVEQLSGQGGQEIAVLKAASAKKLGACVDQVLSHLAQL